jgi:hypothetical protein
VTRRLAPPADDTAIRASPPPADSAGRNWTTRLRRTNDGLWESPAQSVLAGLQSFDQTRSEGSTVADRRIERGGGTKDVAAQPGTGYPTNAGMAKAEILDKTHAIVKYYRATSTPPGCKVERVHHQPLEQRVMGLASAIRMRFANRARCNAALNSLSPAYRYITQSRAWNRTIPRVRLPRTDQSDK